VNSTTPWIIGTSRVVTAVMARSPTPGSPKMRSMRIAPPSRLASWVPITVTTGTSAFLSACFTITTGPRRPLARAVRMYSCSSTPDSERR
jgi:hypothetical protein